MSSDIPKFVVCEVCRLRVEACKCEEQPQPLQPPQPGDDVWVRAVVDMTYKCLNCPDTHVRVEINDVDGDAKKVWVPTSSIHPAPPASAKKGEFLLSLLSVAYPQPETDHH